MGSYDLDPHVIVIGSTLAMAVLMIPLASFVASKALGRFLVSQQRARHALVLATYLPVAALVVTAWLLLESRLDHGRWPIAIGVHPSLGAPWAEPQATYPGTWVTTLVLFNLAMLSSIPFAFLATLLVRNGESVRRAASFYTLSYVALATFLLTDPGYFSAWFID